MAIDTRTRPSCFMITKGALVEATYRAFESWDLNESMKANIKRIRETNYIGAPSIGWLKDFGKVLNRRFDSVGRDKTLIDLRDVLIYAGKSLELPVRLYDSYQCALAALLLRNAAEDWARFTCGGST